ncbi:fibronectin type III domain-containing protein [Solitalea koreensis]|uniref:Fibronectin type-III domain-containing protein n=1 Tax=Solitalea koreensis TaxID=543615 RepID=A0A521BZM8_9SPHI|nr:hypothetical protein [Solitalea koreensis]SMO52637.1 hypothetical protein SAMN06265350_10377 [Solitalea koreensis]
MKQLHVLIIGFFLMLISLEGHAQTQDSTQYSKKQIALLARALPDSIILRWAPSSYEVWQQANKYGYSIYRYTLIKNNQMQSMPAPVVLGSAFKPLPLPAWEPNLKANNKYAAIMAQAIYGESFELTGGNSNNPMVQLANVAKEQENRFSFAMFCADQSPLAAQMAALRWVDRAIKRDEKYVYKVFVKTPEGSAKIDTGFVFIGTEDYTPLPKPIDLRAEFGNRSVLLSWNKFLYEDVYTSYVVERSENGTDFIAITPDPLINTSTGDLPHGQLMYKADSLSANYKKYYYRVRGISPFGELGPPSSAIEGEGRVPLSDSPAIEKAEEVNGKAYLEWHFPDTLAKTVSNFEIWRSVKIGGVYQQVAAQLPQTQRNYTDEHPLSVAYYKVVAISRFKERAESFPFMVQLVDSIPPDAPKGLIGKIDTAGIVTLRWAVNAEPDLLGYRVFQGNDIDQEFSQLTKSAILKNQFKDTLDLQTLTKKIYYRVTAIDKRYNSSVFSEILELKRPDKTPPVPPSLKQLKADEKAVYLSWNPSSSADVAKHIVYRKGKNSPQWEKLAVLPKGKNDSSYADNSAEAGMAYLYKLAAVDEGGLESVENPEFESAKITSAIKPTIDRIYGVADRNAKKIVLRWNYKEKGIERYIIFREAEGDKMRIYTTVDASINEYEDKNLTINTAYKYALQALFADGRKSEIGKSFSISY